MDGFAYQDGHLFAEQQSLAEIAKQVGTPFYIYSAKGIKENYLRLQNAFGKRKHDIHYAIKANPNLAILALLNQLGAGFDVVSSGELSRVFAAGATADKIVFSGVGKSHADLHYALKSAISMINVESEAELYRLQQCAEQQGSVAKIAIRINPDVDAGTHKYISTGLKENKFGVDQETAFRLYLVAKSLKNINPTGIAYHIGSQLTSVDPFIEAAGKTLSLVDKLANHGISLTHLDIGGGLGIQYRDETPPSYEDYVNQLVSTVDKSHPYLQISIEPGRSIVGNAGLLVTKIEYLKTNYDKHFAIVDAAMNDLIRPALYQAWMNITQVNLNSSAPKHNYDIVGPVCESADFLGKDRTLSIEQNDLLAIHSAGAYAMSMSSNYNSRPRPAEVLVDGDKFHIIRQRESFENLFDKEIIPDF